MPIKVLGATHLELHEHLTCVEKTQLFLADALGFWFSCKKT